MDGRSWAIGKTTVLYLAPTVSGGWEGWGSSAPTVAATRRDEMMPCPTIRWTGLRVSTSRSRRRLEGRGEGVEALTAGAAAQGVRQEEEGAGGRRQEILRAWGLPGAGDEEAGDEAAAKTLGSGQEFVRTCVREKE